MDDLLGASLELRGDEGLAERPSQFRYFLLINKLPFENGSHNNVRIHSERGAEKRSC